MAVKDTLHASAASPSEIGPLCVGDLAHPEINLDQPTEVTRLLGGGGGVHVRREKPRTYERQTGYYVMSATQTTE
jgi:hypothetical protein